MNDNQDPSLVALRRVGRLVATAVLAGVAALLAYQMIGEPLAALGAGLGAGAATATLWGGFVIRPEGVSLGRAVGVGFFATFGAFLGAAILAGATSRVTFGGEAVAAASFAMLVVLPMMVATALAVAVLTRAKAAR